MDEAILDFLRQHPGEFVSGEEISRKVNVTRTAIWKRVEKLRASGYEIQASRRLGYRLIRSPDLLTPSEIKAVLKTERMGKVIHYVQTIPSTNTEAYQLALRGAEEGEVVIAESQQKGRGRLGRHWVSPPFVNLYLSLVLRPSIPPDRASLVTLMAAVATAEAIQASSGLQPAIKWPNDILLNEHKVAGLLNEIHSEADRVHFVILGVGVNLNSDRTMFPEEIRDSATSLKLELGRPVSRRAFVASLLMSLEKWYTLFRNEGGNPVLEAWKEWARIEGKSMRIVSFGETVVGKAVGIDSEGKLILKTESGERRIIAGDVQYRE